MQQKKRHRKRSKVTFSLIQLSNLPPLPLQPIPGIGEHRQPLDPFALPTPQQLLQVVQSTLPLILLAA